MRKFFHSLSEEGLPWRNFNSTIFRSFVNDNNLADLGVALEHSDDMSITWAMVNQIDLFISFAGKIRLNKLMRLQELQLIDWVNSSLSLLMWRDLVLSWSDNTSQIGNSSELKWHLSLINTFDIVIQKVVIANVVEPIDINIFCGLPLIKMVSLSVSWQDSITHFSKVFIMRFNLGVDIDGPWNSESDREHIWVLCDGPKLHDTWFRCAFDGNNMPVRIKNDLIHVSNVGSETFCERSLRLLLVCVDDLLMLFKALSDLSPVLLLEFLPFVEVCVIRRVWAFCHLGVLFFRFICLVNLFFLLIH